MSLERIIGRSEVRVVENRGALYSRDVPEDLLASGDLLSIQDFHEAAPLVGLKQASGTIAFKKAVVSNAEQKDPFLWVPSLNANPAFRGICTNFGFIGVILSDFYIKTQALHDQLLSIHDSPETNPYSKNGEMILRAVVFDQLQDEI